MEKESASKRCCISLPWGVPILITLLSMACLSFCTVLWFQIDLLKSELREQMVTLRKLQASKSNGTTLKQRDLETLQRRVEEISAKPNSQSTFAQISESIHLVGDDKKFPLKALEQRVRSWSVFHKQGDIKYVDKDGAIVISVAGTYYIYSQMHYYNEKEHLTGHITYINERKILESIVGISKDSYSKHFTKQHGGVFRVERNDRIQVRVPFTHNSYEFTRISSYFGAYRVGP